MGRYSAGLANECLDNLNREGETLEHNIWKAIFTFDHCEDGDFYEGHKEKLAAMNSEYERVKNEEEETNLLILKYQIEEFCAELKAFDEADQEMDDWEYENNQR